jgi:hypothetical protein
MDGKITPPYGPGMYVLWQGRLYRVPPSIDGEGGLPLLALPSVGAGPLEPGDMDEYESLLRACQVQHLRWH